MKFGFLKLSPSMLEQEIMGCYNGYFRKMKIVQIVCDDELAFAFKGRIHLKCIFKILRIFVGNGFEYFIFTTIADAKMFKKCFDFLSGNFR